MHTEKIEVSRREAERLYREYSKHRAYGGPMDEEITRTYYHLAKGRTIIRALESIKAAGLDRDFLPKLAIVSATAKECHLRRERSGAIVMSSGFRGVRVAPKRNTFRLGADSFNFPAESFPIAPWATTPGTRQNSSEHVATSPIVPLHLRPQRGLENYHILFEAEWKRIPPRDPYLLRRIGQADLWLVVAAWDLTEVERAVLATRISVQ